VSDLACIEEVELITDYLEGALPPEQVRRFEQHLDTCPSCTEYLEQMRAVTGSLRGLREQSLPAELRERIMRNARRPRGH
jgi:anti-sigma factor (TIGR02949 family)